MWTPKWVLSHLFAAVMAVTMTGLGFWQLNRLDERRNLNQEIEAASQAAPVPVADLLAERAAGAPVRDHRATVVSGIYRPDLSFLVANRTFDTRPGSWLVTPVAIADGRLVLVARGWVSRPWVADNSPQTAPTPTEPVEVTGRAFASVSGGRLGTSSTTFPEVSRLDVAAVTELLGVEVEPLWVQLEAQQPRQADSPVPVPPPVLDDGPHLSYAFQWFFFASGTVVVYALILRRRRRELLREQRVANDRNPGLLLLAVRLRSRGRYPAVAETAGWLGAAIDQARLDDLESGGWVARRGDPARFSLTTAGDQELADWLTQDLTAAERAEIETTYQAFLAVNRNFLAFCARWAAQSAEPSTDRLVELDQLISDLAPLLTEVEAVRARFGSYRPRLDQARARASQNPDWFESPRVDSAHTVWFELHEHLLATLGRDRVADG